jgi:hypothetical protein
VSNIYRLCLVSVELVRRDGISYTIHLLLTGYVDIYPLKQFSLGFSSESYSAAETGIGLICGCLPAISGWFNKEPVNGR